MRHLIWLGCSLLVACTSRPYAESGWELHVALETQAKLGGCVVADLDPRHAGNEIAVTASTGHVYCVRRVGTGWATEIICHQEGEMIQVAAGDLNPEHPGDELICVGAARGGSPHR